MADVIGPNRYLPGNILGIPAGAMCDDHPNVPAVARVVGPTDSFGSELLDLCQTCLDEMKNAGPRIGTCDWCKTKNVELRDKRDYEEGMCGRVYEICSDCNDRYNARIAEEYDSREYISEDYD